MKTALVTFYQRHRSPERYRHIDGLWQPDGANEEISVFNGFSLVRHLFPDATDVFVDEQDGSPLLGLDQYDRVLVSVFFARHFLALKDVLDHRWILGGPACRFARVPPYIPAESVVTSSAEAYLGVEVSGQFTEYWQNAELPTDRLRVTVSVGSGCEWSRCRYCSERRKYFWERPNPRAIVESLTDPRIIEAHLGMSSPSLRTLKAVTAAKRTVRLCTFVRPTTLYALCADEKSLRGWQFSLGLEAFSNAVLRDLNREALFEVTLTAAAAALDRGAGVTLTAMTYNPRERPDEMRRNLALFCRLLDRYPGRISVVVTGPSEWASKEQALRFSTNVRKASTGYGWWAVPEEAIRLAWEEVLRELERRQIVRYCMAPYGRGDLFAPSDSRN